MENNCCHKKHCLLPKDCKVVGCVLSNHLIKDKVDELYEQLGNLDEGVRLRYVNKELSKIQPPKVKGSDIRRWWGFRLYWGVDIDKQFKPKIKKAESPKVKIVKVKSEKPAPKAKPLIEQYRDIILQQEREKYLNGIPENTVNFHY